MAWHRLRFRDWGNYLNLVYNNGKLVCNWVAAQLKSPLTGQDFEPCVAIGIEDQGKLIAGCIFNNMRNGEIEVTFAASSPHWATRENLHALFSYPFQELQVNRVTAFIAKANKRARKVIEGWGFRFEGIKRKGLFGKDAAMYGILPHEARFWKDTTDGYIRRNGHSAQAV